MNRIGNAPAANRGAKQNNFNDSIPPLEKLRSRLENVQQRGDGYRADCPNGHRTKGSLSITESDNGMLLLKCHAGCSALEVLEPIGLQLSDLFERPTETYKTPRQTWEQRELMKMRQWRAARPDILSDDHIVSSGKIDVLTMLGDFFT